MKIACIGSNIESETCLKLFVSEGINIDLLITRPENSAGNVSDYVNLHPFCKEQNIPVVSTTNVNSQTTIEELRNHDIDVLLTLGWSQIFKSDFLSCFGKVIGSHPTKLPNGRGRAPVPWTILKGDKASAVSFFYMDEGIDTGDVILQKEFKIPERANALTVYNLVAENLSAGFVEILGSLLNGRDLKVLRVNQEAGTHTAKRTKADGRLDFSFSAESVDRLVRAVSYPYPGAYSFYKSQRVFFFSSEIAPFNDYEGVEGQILEIENDSIRVKCGEGSVWLSDYKDEWGVELDSDTFKVHDKLGLSVEDELFELKNELRKKGIIE